MLKGLRWDDEDIITHDPLRNRDDVIGLVDFVPADFH
jgi:hypothetical protein